MPKNRDLEKEREELLAHIRTLMGPELLQALQLAASAPRPAQGEAPTYTSTSGSHADPS